MIRLNLGGGNFHQDGWVNVDYPFEARAGKQHAENIDIAHNFMDKKPIALPDGSVDVIYTEHCIEHLPEDAVAFLFQDVYRLLKTGGAFRISCPDADIVYDHYRAAPAEPLGFNKRFNNDPPEIGMLDVLATPLIRRIDLELVRATFADLDKVAFFNWLTEQVGLFTKEEQARAPGDHLSWWNYEKLCRWLTEYGFRKCRRRRQRESRIEDLRQSFIDRTANKYSVRIECGK